MQRAFGSGIAKNKPATMESRSKKENVVDGESRIFDMEKEVERIKVIRSFGTLDKADTKSLDRICCMASRVFKVEFSAVFLLHLNDCEIVAEKGLQEHAKIISDDSIFIQTSYSESGILVVPDLIVDPHYSDGELAQSELRPRFFAGAPLISSEGIRIGSFCIFSNKPRPEGLVENECSVLTDMAALAVDMMSSQCFQKEIKDNRAQSVACAAHELMTPLTGLQLSLSLLVEDQELKSKLTEPQHEILLTVSRCSHILSTICKKSIEGMRHDKAVSPVSLQGRDPERASTVKDFTRHLNEVLCTIPKNVPVSIYVDESVPQTLVFDDINLFRAALNVLSTACARTVDGSIQMRIRIADDALMIECEDSAPILSIEDERRFFCRDHFEKFQDSSLNSYHFHRTLVTLVDDSCEFGYRRRPQGNGSIFWFSVPTLHLQRFNDGREPVSRESSLDSVEKVALLSNFSALPSRKSVNKKPFTTAAIPTVPLFPNDTGKTLLSGKKISSELSQVEQARPRRVLVVDDSIVVRKSLARSLSVLGFEVYLCENGAEGFKQLQANRYTFCLCDFLMPVMDGLDMIRQLREWEIQQHRSRQYVIGISAHAGGTDAKRGMDAGMDEFLQKPITMDVLRKVCKNKRFKRTESNDLRTGVEGDDSREFSSEASTALLTNKIRAITLGNRHDAIHQTTPSDGVESEESTHFHCLVVEMPPHSQNLLEVFATHGWLCTFASTSDEGFQFLQQRNWDAVLIDERIEPESGAMMISRFRTWESQNRFNRQNHIFWMHNIRHVDTANKLCFVQTPFGFDGLLSKPMNWDELRRLIDSDPQAPKLSIITH